MKIFLEPLEAGMNNDDRDPILITSTFGASIGFSFCTLANLSVFAWILLPLLCICIFKLVFVRTSDG